jgi:uncharacterized protein (TIGR03437 family)
MRRLLSVFLLPCLQINASAAVVQRNILNNGGFEYGLMCFGNYVWSETDIEYRGDYRFSLSSDAHSGRYSLEIRCAGADCLKAAVFSNRIPTPPGQSYNLSLYAKCPTGRSAAVYVPETTTGEILQSLTCNGTWALNEVSFRVKSAATSFFFSVYNRDVDWLRVDDIVLTYAGGDAPQQTVLHTGVRSATVADKAVMVDGAPYLALGFFEVGYADLQLAANTGANTVVALGQGEAADCFCTRDKSYQDRAYELGLGFVPDSSTTARLGLPDVLHSVAERFAPHLANIAWLLADEPDQAAVPWYYIQGHTLTSEYNAMKSGTSLPVLADFQRAAWSSTSDVAPYVSAVDFWMAEPYGEDFSTVNHAMDMFASLKPRPTWLAQNAIEAPLLVPKAYWAMINGATGIIYFNWDEFKDNPAKLAAAKQAFGEISGLKSVLFGRNIDSLVASSAGVGHIARHDQGAVYILAANPTAALVQAKFTMRGLAAGDQVTVMFENRTITATAGGFSDTFSGVSRHVYAIRSAITSGAFPPAALATVSAASYRRSAALSPASLASAFGQGLASTTTIAPPDAPWPASLAGTAVRVTDSTGTERAAQVWFVSPSQINFYIPEGTALGAATVKVMNATEVLAMDTVQIDSVAPALFSINGTGEGVAAALAIWAKPDGTQTWQYVFAEPCVAPNCVSTPLDRRSDTDRMYLQLYGTGIRGRSSLALEAVMATIGGMNAPVDYAGPMAGYTGLDQVNLRVPRRLAGSGEVDVVLKVDGKTANTVRINIK